MPRATRTIENGSLTETQVKALKILSRAYDEYTAVEIDMRTEFTGGNGRSDSRRATVSRAVANRLTFAGFTMISPAGWYLLLTPKGKAEVGITT